MGLVGESGSGKTTVGHCVIRAYDITDGEIIFRPEGEAVELGQLSRRELRPYRKYMQMIFQDPYSSLDPRKTVFDIVSEPLRINKTHSGKALENRVVELLELVGLEMKYMKRYPHAFSGGQRQRLGIARALALNPKVVICDEAVSALDVSVQAQIINLLIDLQNELGLTYLFIAHDLSVIEHITDEVIVMYVGRLMEQAETKELFGNPKHPYTEALMKSIPMPDPDHPLDDADALEGELPDPANPPTGCYFHPRCKYAQQICREQTPPLLQVGENHTSACHFADELELQGLYCIGQLMTDNRLVNLGWEIPTETYSDQPYVVIADDGAWVCVTTTGSGHEGQPGQHVVTSRSSDHGRTWSPPVAVEPADGPEASYAVLLKTPAGRIYCFYNHNTDNRRWVIADNPPYKDGKCYRVDLQGYFVFKYSDDHGQSWSEQRYTIPIREMEIDRQNAYGGEVQFFWNVGRPFTYDGAAYVSVHKVGGFGHGFFTRSEGVLVMKSQHFERAGPGANRMGHAARWRSRAAHAARRRPHRGGAELFGPERRHASTASIAVWMGTRSTPTAAMPDITGPKPSTKPTPTAS